MVIPGSVRRRLTVEGRVQGVFFRDTCLRLARQAGVAGSARNTDDGSVEIVLEGDPAAVEQLIAWCRTGPPHALVTAVKVSDEEPQGITGFIIR